MAKVVGVKPEPSVVIHLSAEEASELRVALCAAISDFRGGRAEKWLSSLYDALISASAHGGEHDA
jgi:hypothetical protein